MAETSGGEYLARMLQDEGVERVFGIIDGTYFGFYSALHRLGIEIVTPRHETSAAHMAGAYARLTGRLLPLIPRPTTLPEALGRVLAADIVAPIDLPGFTNTAMDGIALAAAATAAASVDQPVQVRLVGAVDAGTNWTAPLAPLEAVRIGTGAAIPDGCDTVIPSEEIEMVGDHARITVPVAPGRHIRQRGEDVRRDTTALRQGTEIRPQEIALLAALGIETISAVPRPRIGLLSIGPELFGSAAPATVHDANGPMLAALGRAAGADVVRIAKTAGSLHDLQRVIGELSPLADLVVTSGGISNSPADTMSEFLETDTTGECWQLRLRPGKHFGVAWRDGSVLIALPGNPVAAFVGFELLVRPAIDGSLANP